MVWAHFTNIRHDKDHLARQGSKKMRKTEEGVGGQHQRVDRPGLLRDARGGRRQEGVEKLVSRSTGYRIDDDDDLIAVDWGT